MTVGIGSVAAVTDITALGVTMGHGHHGMSTVRMNLCAECAAEHASPLRLSEALKILWTRLERARPK